MGWYRLFLRTTEHTIAGRSDFNAADLSSALKIAHRIAQDCSDKCATYDLLEDGRIVSADTPVRSLTLDFLNEAQQQIVTDREIALRDSKWAIRESRQLLAAIEKSSR